MKTSCGPNCCAVSKPGWTFNVEDVHAHVEKHKDGSCDCDACETLALSGRVKQPYEPPFHYGSRHAAASVWLEECRKIEAELSARFEAAKTSREMLPVVSDALTFAARNYTEVIKNGDGSNDTAAGVELRAREALEDSARNFVRIEKAVAMQRIERRRSKRK